MLMMWRFIVGSRGRDRLLYIVHCAFAEFPALSQGLSELASITGSGCI
jgi:hypothetical protein